MELTTASDNDKLERFIPFAAKSIPKFSIPTRTDIALGMLGWLPMRASRTKEISVSSKVVYNVTRNPSETSF